MVAYLLPNCQTHSASYPFRPCLAAYATRFPAWATASEDGSLANITATEGPETGAQTSASANSKAMRSRENTARTLGKQRRRTICARSQRRSFWGTGNNTGSSRSLQDQADRG